MEPTQTAIIVAGRTFSTEDVAVIQGLVVGAPTASRFALAHAVCKQLDWRRPTGKPKLREGRDLLERLEARGSLRLPAKHPSGRRKGQRTSVPLTLLCAPQRPLEASLMDVTPVRLSLVEHKADHAYFRELIGRYHYLGFSTPFGAYLRYFVYSASGRVLGCQQFSSGAWRLAPRDQWIGWTDTVRAERLGRLVQQSRFLILPWVRVPHLASHLLALSARRIVVDWQARFGVCPLLLETMVAEERFRGTCYRAANWIDVGLSTGRGRMDRTHQRHGTAPKRIFLFPLHRRAAEQLRAR